MRFPTNPQPYIVTIIYIRVELWGGGGLLRAQTAAGSGRDTPRARTSYIHKRARASSKFALFSRRFLTPRREFPTIKERFSTTPRCDAYTYIFAHRSPCVCGCICTLSRRLAPTTACRPRRDSWSPFRAAARHGPTDVRKSPSATDRWLCSRVICCRAVPILFYIGHHDGKHYYHADGAGYRDRGIYLPETRFYYCAWSACLVRIDFLDFLSANKTFLDELSPGFFKIYTNRVPWKVSYNTVWVYLILSNNNWVPSNKQKNISFPDPVPIPIIIHIILYVILKILN